MICKTNIVLLTDCLADLAGGAEKQIYELAKRLDKDKYNVFVVSLDCWGQAPRTLIESTGSRLNIFRVVRVYGITGLFQGIRFYNFLRRNKINIILTYHFSSDMWGTWWGHLAGVPVIMSNRRDMGFWRNDWHIKAYRFIDRWVQKIVVVSTSIKQMVIETEGVDPKRIEVIYNGVDIPTQQNKKTIEYADLKLSAGDIVIMHVANLKPVKGHQYLIEAFAGVIGQFPQAKLVLIGKDELNGQIQQMASRLGIQDNVIFLGKRDDIAQLLPLADICVLPSLSEGMSNSILEYMAAAKPVIATSVGGNPELVIDEITGSLVEKANAGMLKSALQDLSGNKVKRELMGLNGLFRATAEFSLEAMMARYDELFKKKISVLHLVSSGGLFGAERVILNLTARSQDVTSYVGAVHNLHNPHLELIDEAKRMGLHHAVFTSRGQFDLNCVGEVRDFMAANDIDILHTHNYKADIIGWWATRGTRKKWIATNHVWHSTDRKLKFYEIIDAMVLKFARQVISVSDEIKDDLLKKGFNGSRLQVIDNGIPIENFNREFPVEQTRLGLGLLPNDIAVLIAGRLAIEKGHDIFLKAAAQAVQEIKNIKFIIAGDGPLAENLKQQSNDLHLSEHVVFTGIRKDMPAVYASCDIMVNASYIEGLPMTILEAMASHLPVIATNVGGVGDVIIDQENGILLKPGDPQSLSRAIIELAQDKEKRGRFAQKAYQDVCERFSDTRMADQYQQIYRQL